MSLERRKSKCDKKKKRAVYRSNRKILIKTPKK